MNSAVMNSIATVPWQRRSLAVGVVALVICGVAAPSNPAPFLRAYLAAYLFYLGIALGSMVLLMAYHLTGGTWGLLIRRILEASMRTLPLMAVLFLPIAYGIDYLYVWAQPEEVAVSAKLQYQQFYLQPTYFWIRAAVYFAAWLAIATLLSAWSGREDQTGNARLARKSLKLSAVGAVVYGISIHFASIDWAMSLEPLFHSSIWGPLMAAGQLLSALAFAIIVLSVLVRRPPLAEVVSLKVINDYGSLLLTLLILWTYMAWCQFMIVWIGNLPVDVVWYLPRATLGWKIVIGAIAVFHFAIPFFLLLMRPIKRSITALAGISALILFMQLVFMVYEILPTFSTQQLVGYWIAVLTPIGIGGIWLAEFLRQLQKRPLLAPHDYNRAAAMHLRHLDQEEAEREETIVYG